MIAITLIITSLFSGIIFPFDFRFQQLRGIPLTGHLAFPHGSARGGGRPPGLFRRLHPRDGRCRGGGRGNAAPLVALLGYVVGIGLAILVSVLAAPMQFHAELAGKFDLGAAFRFTKSFWLTVGGKAVLSWIVFLPLSLLVMIGGLLICFVGIYPASALIQMAGQHLMVQLYDEYLDAGGEPIPLWQPPEEEYDDDDEPRRRKRRRRREEEDREE